ncbi:hypothetical protein [Gloeothece verrucosa]|uniref:hypothetical protein n=1 Tax=Gloeothece verrucosa TaxID=2546359 RepID=UPI00017E23FD|nr:hypothetical protein [Gloeothece verrucosa]
MKPVETIGELTDLFPQATPEIRATLDAIFELDNEPMSFSYHPKDGRAVFFF